MKEECKRHNTVIMKFLRIFHVMALSGRKWEIIYGTDNMHFHNCLEIGYCHYGNGTICVAEKRIAISCRYDNIYSKKHTTSDMSYTGGAWKKNKNGNIYLWMWKKF
mgnify:CR=1 FL=1